MRSGDRSPRQRATAILLVALTAAATGLRAGAAGDLPGSALAARVEAHLAREKGALRQTLGHYGLVFPVEEAELRAFMGPVRVYGEGGALVLGTRDGLELHGGGLLALLFAFWRPEGRAPTLADRFPFGPRRAPVPLSALYEAQRGQTFLPVSGLAYDQIRGALPETPTLARLRLPLPGGAGAVERDAYALLGLLTAEEADLSSAWTNQAGQRLRVDILLDHARRHYLTSEDTDVEPEDHSNLHLVALLLASARRQDEDPEPIQRRFLANELRRRSYAPADATLLLGHHAESLGELVADPRVVWSAQERADARAWLEWVEGNHFHDLGAEEPRRLAHLLRGLRLVLAHPDRVE